MLYARKIRGFSLIELVMVIVIMSIISVVIAKFMNQAYQDFLTANNINNAEWQAYLAIERIANEAHNIRSASDISTVNATQFAFTDMNAASVTYSLSGSTLSRNSQTLASGVQSLSFTYYDKNGAVTATPSSVRYILISITASQNNMPATFTTTVGLRGMI